MKSILFLLSVLPILCQSYGTATNAVNGAPVARTPSYMRSQSSGRNALGDPTLIGYWPLTDPADQAYDYSGNSLTGVFHGVTPAGGVNPHPNFLTCPAYCGKLSAWAAYFNASAPDYFLTPSVTVPTSGFTVSAWVNPNAGLHQYARILETANTFTNGFFLGSNSAATPTQFLFIVSDSAIGTCTSNISGGMSIGTNTWYMVTATWDGTYGRLYVNGSLATGSNGTCTFGTQSGFSLTSQAIRVGCGFTTCSGSSGGGGWNGEIQDVRIYSRVLPATEIAALYSAENTIP